MSNQLDNRRNVVEALDALINKRAYEASMGRWDYLQSLTEIDASHWNKILHGKTKLSDKKFHLLSEQLGSEQSELDGLSAMFEAYREHRTQTDGRRNRPNQSMRLKDRLRLLAEQAGIEWRDLSDPLVLSHLVYKAIGDVRIAGDAEAADLNGQDLFRGIMFNALPLDDMGKEWCLIDLATAHAYVGYETGDEKQMRRVLHAARSLSASMDRSSGLQAACGHIERRICEEFQQLGVNKLVSIQDKAAEQMDAFVEYSESYFGKLNNIVSVIRANKYKLRSRVTGLDKDCLQLAKENIIQAVGEVGYVENHLISRSQVAEIEMRTGKLDEANQILADCITTVDRRLGTLAFARKNIRHTQAIVAVRQYELTGSEDDAEAAIGFYGDAIKLAQEAGNIVSARGLDIERRVFLT